MRLHFSKSHQRTKIKAKPYSWLFFSICRKIAKFSPAKSLLFIFLKKYLFDEKIVEIFSNRFPKLIKQKLPGCVFYLQDDNIFFCGFLVFIFVSVFRHLEFGDVQAFVDDFGDGSDLRTQFLFDAVQCKAIVISNQVDRHT